MDVVPKKQSYANGAPCSLEYSTRGTILEITPKNRKKILTAKNSKRFCVIE
jgi:hypothetical protein